MRSDKGMIDVLVKELESRAVEVDGKKVILIDVEDAAKALSVRGLKDLNSVAGYVAYYKRNKVVV